MNRKRIFINEIVLFLGEDVISIDGDYKAKYIDHIADIQHVDKTTLDWVNPTKKNKQEIAERSKAETVLVDSTITPIDGKILIHVKNPKTSLAKVGNKFFVDAYVPGIHPTAIIDNDAEIGENVYIGPYCVIRKAKIGANSIIESYVKIYDNVEMGENCHIYDSVVLGAPGFGWEKDENGNNFRFPQIGGVIIGNNVEIGCQSCVDRGALSDTVIGDYTKIDSDCKIAHNNIIGQNVVVTGSNSIAGSNVIEDNVWIGPNCSFKEWGHIGRGSFIGIGSVVITNVKEKERVFGNPAGKFF